jgi:hypothetical protein
MKILLNYDYKAYPYTTASYIEMAGKKMEGVEVIRLPELGDQKPDLIINIMPFDEIKYMDGVPACLWEIDNHLVRGQNKDYYDLMDKVYIPQESYKDNYPVLKTDILPLAVDPDLHKRIEGVPIKYDIGFIGNDTYPERRELLELMERKYKVLRTTTPPGLPYSEALSSCALTFNRSMDKDINMRFFESIATGRLLLTDYLPQQDKYATNHAHYEAYTDWKDLDEKVSYYLANESEREQIGKDGAEHIKTYHTYKHRLEKILQDFNLLAGES